MPKTRAVAKSPLRFRFEAEIIPWRGPAPFFFAPMPLQQAAALRQIANRVSYGWGCIPVEAKIGAIVFTTALIPKDETYLLPIKAVVRRKANLTAGDAIAVTMTVQPVSARVARLASP